MAKFHWSKPICKEPGNYVAWPTVARTREGELLVVFSGDREEHVCPYGKTELIRSSDAGVSWSAPQVINSTPLDDRDAGIIVLESGTLVVSWFTGPTWLRFDLFRRLGLWAEQQLDSWDRHCRKLSEETRQRWWGQWTRRSTDGGRTWEPAVASIVTAPHGPIQISDGRLVSVGNAQVDERQAILCVESTDEGRSWRLAGTVCYMEKRETDTPFAEPHVAEVAAGQLVVVMRSEMEATPNIHSCRSSDGGKTWSIPEQTPLNGYHQPPHLLRLRDGRLLCTYGRRAKPFGQRACVSEDRAGSWRRKSCCATTALTTTWDIPPP